MCRSVACLSSGMHADDYGPCTVGPWCKARHDATVPAIRRFLGPYPRPDTQRSLSGGDSLARAERTQTSSPHEKDGARAWLEPIPRGSRERPACEACRRMSTTVAQCASPGLSRMERHGPAPADTAGDISNAVVTGSCAARPGSLLAAVEMTVVGVGHELVTNEGALPIIGRQRPTAGFP